jgi:lipopolysaccharide transport system ATP-binding protein|tara:strand:+ start:1269 stop:1970 length:702 start_codon:yes stop_codon:yes gene_type:complete
MRETVISLKDVALWYRLGRTLRKNSYYKVLKSITFDVQRGETLGIIGRNGAGKSTLLKLLADIYEPDSGIITNKAHKTSLLTLSAGFDQQLSGRDNAVISGMLLGYSKSKVEAELENIKEYSELGDFFYQPISTYSSGMRARLGFATAVYTTPEILLIDETLSVGDAVFEQKARKTMENMIKSDQTVVLVSHSISSVKKLCDRVIWIEHGLVERQGNAAEVVAAYSQAFNKEK